MKSIQPQSEYAMTYAEIGRALGISPACAKQTCYNGLKKLARGEKLLNCMLLADYAIELRQEREKRMNPA